jgi:hypothetical protein
MRVQQMDFQHLGKYASNLLKVRPDPQGGIML